ncbi:hypothetical protein OG21DRAFT_1417058 [Imleria badia]|nr:hypothetical protein OG21DRAFT_1417058 [Imleria badia]
MLPLGKSTSRVLKRQGSIFTHPHHSSLSVTSTSTSTTSSHHLSPSASSIALPQSVTAVTQSSESLPSNPPGLSTTRRRRSGDKVPQLYLRLNTVPVPPTDDRVALSLPPTPCTSTPPTPTTPAVPDIAEIRRKRMAKLARHLGEHVPAQLVFPSESAPQPAMTSPNSRTRSRTQSVHVIPAEVASVSDNRPFLARPMQDWEGEWNRSNIKDVQKELRGLKGR